MTIVYLISFTVINKYFDVTSVTSYTNYQNQLANLLLMKDDHDGQHTVWGSGQA